MNPTSARRRVAMLLMAASIVCSSSALSAAEPTQSDADRAAEERFDIWEIRVLGNTVLPNARIEQAVYPMLGPSGSIARVEQARVALEKLYRDGGFGTVFVDIPEQDVADGIVRLQVTEGRLDRVRVTGARYFSNRQIRAAVPSLDRGAVPHLPALQRELGRVNQQSRDRQITPVLRAGREPGMVDVELKVKDEAPLHGTAEVNNRYTANTSKARASVTLSYDNLWQKLHSFSAQYQTAPEEPDEARVIAATYVAPFVRTGHVLALYAVDTDSEFAALGADFAELGILGKGRIYGARYVMPLTAGEQYFHSVTLGGDYKDFEEVITQADGTEAPTPISYANWSTTYAGTYRTERTFTSFDLTANFGIRALANDSYEFYFKRSSGQPNKGEPNYMYLRGSAQYERPLLFGTRLYARVAGQFSPHALISNEQFSIGGADTVRGYVESEELGDYGANGSIEWRMPLASPALRKRLQDLYFFTFYDAGIVRLQYPLPDQQASFELHSAGAGLRIGDVWGFDAELDWAYALTTTDNTDEGDSRIHFRLQYGF